MTPAVLEALLVARVERRSAVLATRLDDGAQVLVDTGGAEIAEGLGRAAADCLTAGRSARVTVHGADWFLHLHAPPPRLIVIGAVHIAQSLVPMAMLAGADVVVCDPRGRYATQERFPGAVLRHDWPDVAVAAERPDRNSAVVALCHDPKLDDPALEAALASTCGYIGALGSRRSHAGRLARLGERGASAASLRRVLGPVGLDIGAVGAGEIAVAILAEWIAQRRGAAVRDRGALAGAAV